MHNAPTETAADIVGSLLDLKDLLERYKDTEFQDKIEELVDTNTKIRKVSRDGNCFYVSVIFLILESVERSREAQKNMAVSLAAANTLLQQAGVEEFIIEEFSGPITELIRISALREPFNPKILDSIFWVTTSTYFRMITSAYVKMHREEFDAFIEEDIVEYCTNMIEADKAYAGEVEQAALTQALGISLDIIYLERTGKVERTVGGNRLRIGTLLYMPEHFDIVYRSVE
ncbi:ubiquitin thioesterase protein OTUB1 [Nematocida sp. AWRm77]|nr:ubiquitin thioesterase protein OTUB1 [Nematocida sp. AWRm77]